MSVPKPVIYLRNTFRLKADRERQFMAGKEHLLRNVPWTLVAGWGQWPLFLDQKPVESSFDMTQVWRLDKWDSLYNSIYAFSETSWYRSLGDSLLSEDQELLVGVTSGYRESPRPLWKSDVNPGYCYLYEESLPSPGNTHSYLRDVNWLAAQLSPPDTDWRLAWAATQITAHPSVLCLLWRVPSIDSVARTLSAIANREETALRYHRMMRLLTTTSRDPFHPIYTERLDDLIRQGKPEPIVKS
jgi:hypothetical protein